jgi:hypothetical protein
MIDPDKIDPNVTGVYRCKTSEVNAIINDMLEDSDVSWGDRLTTEQVICLQWVFSHLEAELNESDDPEHIWVTADELFAKMVETDGTFVVTVDAEAKEVKIDFQPNEGTEGDENV